MKKLLISLLALIVIVSVASTFVHAENNTLVPSDVEWYDEADMFGTTCEIKFEDGKAIVSGSTAGTWPAIATNFDPENCIVADIDTYSLHYDFVLENGQTNISMLFSKDAVVPDNGLTFPISNSALGDVIYDSGSGDLQPDHYRGYIALKDLVASVTNYDKKEFDASFVVDNALIFSGIKIYSVGGGKITINALEIVANDDIPEEPSEDPVEPSEDPAPAESSTPAEESKKPTEEPSKAPESEAASAAESAPAPATENDNTLVIVIVVAAVVVVAVVVAVVVIAKKKKK